MAISAASLVVDVTANTKDVESGLKRVTGAFGDVAKTAAGFVLGAAFTKAPGLLFDAAQAAADDAASMGRLQQAIDNTAGGWDAYAGQVNDAIANGQKLAFSDDQVRNALSVMTAQTGDAGEAMHRLHTAEDLARGTGMDLEAASRLLGKTTDENVNTLKRYGISVEKGATAQDLLNKVDERFGGQAAKFAETGAGQWAIFKDQLGEVEESLGYVLLPLFTKLGSLLLTYVIPALNTAVEKGFKPAFDAIGDVATALAGPIYSAGRKVADLLLGPLTSGWVAIHDAVVTFKQAVTGDWTNSKAITPFHRVVGQVGLILHDSVIPGVQGALDAFKRLAPYIQTAWRYFNDLLTVLNPFATILKDVALGFGEDGLSGILPGVKQGLDDVLGSAKDLGSGLLTAFGNIDWGAVWGDVSAAGSGLLSSITSAVSGIDWSSVASTIASGIGTAWGALTDVGGHIWNWVSNGVGNIQWGDIAGVIATGVGTAWGALTTAGQAVYNWVVGGLTSVNWTALATSIASSLGAAWSLLTDGATYVYNWISAGLSGLDWNALATTIKGYIATAIGAGAELVNAVKAALTGPDPTAYYQTGYGIGFTAGTGIGAGLKDGQPKDDGFWATYKRNASENLAGITAAFSEVAASAGRFAGSVGKLLGALEPEFKAAAITAGLFALAGSKVVGFLADLGVAVGKIDLKILSGAFNVAAGQVSAFADDIKVFNTKVLPVLGTAASTAALAVVSAFNTLSTDLGSALDSAIGGVMGFATGVETGMGIVSSTVSGMWDTVSGVLSTFVGGVSQAGLDALSGIQSALSNLPSTIGGIFTGMVTGVTGIVSGLVSQMPTFGNDLIANFSGGIAGAMGGLFSLVQSIPSGIISAVSGIDLFSIGSAIIQGLIDGINSMIGPLQSALSYITDLVPDWKGPPEKDATLLYDNGVLIMQGLIGGLVSQLQPLEGQLTAIGHVIETGLVPVGALLGETGHSHGVIYGNRVRDGADEALASAPTIGDLILAAASAGIDPLAKTGELAGQDVANALVNGVAAGLPEWQNIFELMHGDALTALAQMQTDLEGKIRLAGIVGDDTSDLQKKLDAINTIIATWAEQTGLDFQEEVNSILAPDISADITQGWLDLLGNIDDIVSGDFQQGLQDQLTKISNELTVAVATGAPQAVIDALTAQQAAIEAQLTEAGLAYQAAIDAGMTDPDAWAQTQEKLKQQVDDSVSYLDSLANGSAITDAQDRMAKAQQELALAYATGASQDVIQAINKEFVDAQADFNKAASDTSAAIAAGIASPEAIKAYNEAMGIVTQIPIDQLLATLPDMSDFGVSLIDDLAAGIVDGSTTVDDAMSVLNGMVTASLSDLDDTNDLAVSDIIAQLQTLEEQLTGDLAQAFIDGSDPSAISANLAAVEQLLADLQAQADATAASITDVFQNPQNSLKGGAYTGGGIGGNAGGGGGGGTSGTGAFFNTGSGYPVAAPTVNRGSETPAPVVNVTVNATLDGAAITQNVETRVLSFARAM